MLSPQHKHCLASDICVRARTLEKTENFSRNDQYDVNTIKFVGVPMRDHIVVTVTIG